jgi:predicted RNase H-like nuclease
MDDLLDACAALWTANRITDGIVRRFPLAAPSDRLGLRMEIVA